MSQIDPTSSDPAMPGSKPESRAAEEAPSAQVTPDHSANHAGETPPKVEDHLETYLQAELQEMAVAWKLLVKNEPLCPCWTWREVQEALLDLTETPVEELVLRGALSGLVKQAAFKPQELILAELIRLIRAGHDLVLQRSARAMLEGEMS